MNAARALKGVPLKARRRGQSPPTHGNLFRQLETNFVNGFVDPKLFEKSKIALLDFSPNLPQGFREEGEFAAFIKGVPLKHAAKREKPLPSKANSGVSLQLTEICFVSSKQIS